MAVAAAGVFILTFFAGSAQALEPKVERIRYDDNVSVFERASADPISPVDTEDVVVLGRTVTLGKGYLVLGRGVCSFIYLDRDHWIASCRILSESYKGVSAFLERPRVERRAPERVLLMANSCPLWGACTDVTCAFPAVASTVAALATELSGYDSDRLAAIKEAFRYSIKTDGFMALVARALGVSDHRAPRGGMSATSSEVAGHLGFNTPDEARFWLETILGRVLQ